MTTDSVGQPPPEVLDEELLDEEALLEDELLDENVPLDDELLEDELPDDDALVLELEDEVVEEEALPPDDELDADEWVVEVSVVGLCAVDEGALWVEVGFGGVVVRLGLLAPVPLLPPFPWLRKVFVAQALPVGFPVYSRHRSPSQPPLCTH